MSNKSMTKKDSPILPGTVVVVDDQTSIYNGYEGFIQRISGDRAALLIDSHPWEKLITMPLKLLKKK